MNPAAHNSGSQSISRERDDDVISFNPGCGADVAPAPVPIPGKMVWLRMAPTPASAPGTMPTRSHILYPNPDYMDEDRHSGKNASC